MTPDPTTATARPLPIDDAAWDTGGAARDRRARLVRVRRDHATHEPAAGALRYPIVVIAAAAWAAFVYVAYLLAVR